MLPRGYDRFNSPVRVLSFFLDHRFQVLPFLYTNLCVRFTPSFITAVVCMVL